MICDSAIIDFLALNPNLSKPKKKGGRPPFFLVALKFKIKKYMSKDQSVETIQEKILNAAKARRLDELEDLINDMRAGSLQENKSCLSAALGSLASSPDDTIAAENSKIAEKLISKMNFDNFTEEDHYEIAHGVINGRIGIGYNDASISILESLINAGVNVAAAKEGKDAFAAVCEQVSRDLESLRRITDARLLMTLLVTNKVRGFENEMVADVMMDKISSNENMNFSSSRENLSAMCKNEVKPNNSTSPVNNAVNLNSGQNPTQKNSAVCTIS